MPVRYRFDSNIVVIEMVEEYTTNDVRTTILNALADSARPPNSYLLINLMDSRSIYDRSSEDIKVMANFVGSLGNRFNNRIALVAPNDLIYGPMRMGSVGAEERGVKSEIFRTFEEARKWLLS
jgi:hypothetical protein